MRDGQATKLADELCDAFDQFVKDAGGGDLSDPLKLRMRIHVKAALLNPVDNAAEHIKEEARIAQGEEDRQARIAARARR